VNKPSSPGARLPKKRKRPKVSEKKRPIHLFFARRIHPAISTIRLLLAGLIRDIDGKQLVMARWISLAHRFPDQQFCIRTDASPFGFGAILFRHGAPLMWLAGSWEKDDLFLFKATIGNPAWQAEWELLAILIALDTWLPLLRGEAACLLQADATAALHTASKMAGKTPAMNAMAAEIAMRLESAQVSWIPEHFKGVLNFECDALSRIAQGAAVPARLTSALCQSRGMRTSSGLGLGIFSIRPTRM
jgi:hypothetical protein